MATLNCSPNLTDIRKNSDGSFSFFCQMVDGSGRVRGVQVLNVATDGTVTCQGQPTGTNLTAAQLTALNTNWNTYQTGINTMDAANKVPMP